MAGLKDNMYVLLTIVSAQGCHDNCVTPSAHNHAVLGLPHALQFLDSNLPPDSIHFGSVTALGRVQLFVGVLIMGIEHLPRNKRRRPAEPSLRVDENTDCAVSLPEENDAPSLRGDAHGYDMHSLLEENALLRRILVKMELVLKKVVDPK